MAHGPAILPFVADLRAPCARAKHPKQELTTMTAAIDPANRYIHTEAAASVHYELLGAAVSYPRPVSAIEVLQELAYSFANNYGVDTTEDEDGTTTIKVGTGVEGLVMVIIK